MEEKILEMIITLTGCNELKQHRNIDLLENDILDSLAFIELISNLEDEFNIEIQPTQVPPDTWRSVEKISNFIASLQQ